jgi:hypothetical protein
VTITGAAFTGSAVVNFGDQPAASSTVISPDEITAVSPQGEGLVDITVTTPNGTSAIVRADEFTYVAPVPTITGVSPSSGPFNGNTLVTITGTGFTLATSVKFGDMPASFDALTHSSTEITAFSPAQAPGAHNIYVTTPGGTNAPVAADMFTYTGPVVTAVSPNTGPTSGGTTVTITGTGFFVTSGVDFGTVPAASFNEVSPTEITAVSPAQSAGEHNIIVTSAGGTSSPLAADVFNYVAPPTVTSISPSSGPTTGGTTVTITGTVFNGATKVLFGTVAASSFSVVSSTDIRAVSPAQASGFHNIYVTTPAGTSAPVTADQFTYAVEPPTVTAVSPSSGPLTGGTTISITGTNFTGATKVLFGTVAATSFTVVSSTDISAVSPAQAAAAHNIYVSTPDGTSAPVTADLFTYVAPPTVTSISPTSGPTTGGTQVTISGTNLANPTAVLFGTVPARFLTLETVSPTGTIVEIIATAPAQAAGFHNIYVTTPGGTSAAVAADEFTYVVPVPAVTSISPSSGPTTGGTPVTITGTGFTGATKVNFGTVAATSFTVVSSTDISAVSPAQAAAAHNIYVTTPDGTSSPVADDMFTYTSVPTTTLPSPNVVSGSDGTMAMIAGSTAATNLVFDTVAAMDTSITSTRAAAAVSDAMAGTFAFFHA